MIRISKLADYGIVLLTQFARDPENSVYNARELAAAVKLPLPTVSKLLKSLSRARLLVGQRGINGGYRLARPPDRISVAEVIAVLEGGFALTECSRDRDVEACDREPMCQVRGNWMRINQVVREALSALKLSHMVRPLPQVWPPRSRAHSVAAAAGPAPGAPELEPA